MKIVRLSKNSNSNRIDKVFKWFRFSGRGPQGPAGTIGTLDTLDPKVTPIDADLMLVGDSADSFANKKITWANIKATLKAFFDPLYAAIGHTISSHDTAATGANLTELTDASVTALHSHAGGGGGGIYEVVESRTLTGNVEEIFTVGGEDDIMFIYENMISSLATSLLLYMSSDNGLSYPSTHQSFLQRLNQANAELLSSNLNFAFVYLTRTNSIWFSGWTKLHALQSAFANQPNFESKVNHNSDGANGYRTNVEGWNNTAGPVTNIKFSGLNTFTGKIYMLKRVL